MDDEIREILDVYHEQFSDLLKHLKNNPLVSEKHMGNFLAGTGSQVFRIGTELAHEMPVGSLSDHSIVVVPDDFMGEARRMLEEIQSREANKVLKEKLRDVTSEAEATEVQEQFNKFMEGIRQGQKVTIDS